MKCIITWNYFKWKNSNVKCPLIFFLFKFKFEHILMPCHIAHIIEVFDIELIITWNHFRWKNSNFKYPLTFFLTLFQIFFDGWFCSRKFFCTIILLRIYTHTYYQIFFSKWRIFFSKWRIFFSKCRIFFSKWRIFFF